jgi:methyl-accepting chemotaxis protein WspA
MAKSKRFRAWLTIGKKCLGLTVVNALLLLAVAGTGFWGIHRLSDDADHMLKSQGKIAAHSLAVQNDVLELRRFEKDSFLNCLDPVKTEEYREKFYKAHTNLERNLEALDTLTSKDPNDNERQQLRTMTEQLGIYMTAMEGILNRVRNREIKTPQEGNKAITPYKDAIHKMEDTSVEMADEAKKRMRDLGDDMKQASRKSQWVMAGFSAGALVFGIVLSLLVSRSITRPVRRMSAVLENISAGAGDLTQQLKITSSDEVGAMAVQVNALIKRIHDLVVPIRVAAIQLNATATQIAAAAAEQNGTVQTFNASTTEIAASVRQIAATSADLTRTMSEVEERVHEAATFADAGGSGLRQMEATMQQLSDATGSISEKLGTIREKANGINLMVTTITKVADQTNLLSINAAIEAEKAGEAGRGFLVVAREIRRLADQTAVATLDIEQMVRHMQSAVSAGVMEMDKFSERARSCIAQAAEVSQQIGQALEHGQGIDERFQVVSEGMAQQAEGARQIGEAITQLAASVKQVSVSVKEFTSAAKNLRTSTQSLQGEVGQFTVAS